MLRGIVLGIVVVLVAACGGRSSPGGFRRDGGAIRYDGAPHYGDWWPWKKDVGGVVTPDLRPPKKDLWIPKPDASCLPISAGQMTGTYAGAWKGTLSCPGLAQQTMSGALTLSLQKVAGVSTLFNVSGKLDGKLDPGLPVAGSFSGTMSCTALTATVPSIVIGSGAIVYKLQGGISATYGKTGSGFGWGFPGGAIDIKDPSLGCVASGSWYAYK